MINHNIISRLEQIILASDARDKYEGSNFQREVNLSRDALPFCVAKHLKQKRDDGEPYYFHPIRVAAYANTFIAGYNEQLVRNIALLHDVLEDTDTGEAELISEFGEFVTQHVVELTNVYTKARYPNLSKKERKSREIERLAECSLLTKQIKLCDRMDGLTTFKVATNTNYLDDSERLAKHLMGANPELAQHLLDKIKRYRPDKVKV